MTLGSSSKPRQELSNHSPTNKGPRAMYFDFPLEQQETSIIKRHPPRRLQKLEPIDLPQVITSERLLNQQEARRTHKAKELEKKMQTLMYPSGKRQYLHKMQMLEMNRKRQEVESIFPTKEWIDCLTIQPFRKTKAENHSFTRISMLLQQVHQLLSLKAAASEVIFKEGHSCSSIYFDNNSELLYRELIEDDSS
ncbi:hypothetical protein JEQ12_018320 [Ovis aries]|uniref:Uncharacterized protein n=1 Tax=Ovis aries TaxID=9940 RepID=A0A836A9R4_SHEEP|nr:hypothetical protein JEQ12_018320 [Ovis aries]